MPVIINPGAGPIHGRVKLAEARRNLREFIGELALVNPLVEITHADPLRPDGGRYDFVLTRRRANLKGVLTCEVSMPGLPLKLVRCVDGMHALDFPRLYVDGNSWLWKYAVEIARDALTGVH